MGKVLEAIGRDKQARTSSEIIQNKGRNLSFCERGIQAQTVHSVDITEYHFMLPEL